MFIENTSDPIFFVFPAEPYTPILLYYAHVPAMIISLIMGIFIYKKTNYSLVGRNLLLFFLCFFLWSFINLIAWSYQYTEQLMVWTLFEPLMMLMCLFAFYFFYAFLYDKYPSKRVTTILNVVILTLIIASTQEAFVKGFESFTANAIISHLYFEYAYIISFIISIMILIVYLKGRKKMNEIIKRKARILIIGLLSFLWSYLFFGAYAIFLAVKGIETLYFIELYGLFAMYIFLAALFYMIVKFDAFGIEFKDTQLIIAVLILLVGAQVLFFKDFGDKFFVGITLLIIAGLGYFLIRMIKKEEEKKRLILEKSNQELQKLDQAKNDFINLASHQLKTPLTVIKGVASLMVSGKIDKFSPKEKQQFYQSVWNKSLKLENIVCGILDAAVHADKKSGLISADNQEINIKQLIQKIIDDLASQIQESEVKVEIICKADFLPVVKGQMRFLEEAFTNLIHNAVRYAPSTNGQIKIVITYEEISQSILVKIKDNGIGIPKNELPNLFTRFYRAENAKQRYTDGTGLGLYIVKEIIESHAGKVTVESQENVGSTFSVYLPFNLSINENG